MDTPPLLVPLDPERPEPLFRQLYRGLRQAILGGRLPSGSRLPPTRELAEQLGLSRNTVLAAVEQLRVEGYLKTRVGSGTYVAEALPQAAPASAPEGPSRVSDSGRRCVEAVDSSRPGSYHADAFCPALPAVDLFPHALWARLVGRRVRAGELRLGYGEPLGFAPLRQALAAYLRSARGVACQPEQIIVTLGAQHALSVAARLLLEPGDPAWIEEPGYLGARGALLSAGARLVPVPVDGEGLDPSAGLRRCPEPRLIYCSPSHQFPLGVSMSAARRLALLETATRTGAWILEDDYDSEFRYESRPLAALQGLDRGGRVLYVGTFSKVMFPALRLGYLVVPPALLDAFAAERHVSLRQLGFLEQAALADFLHEGHFSRHVRRMREVYLERRQIVLDGLPGCLRPGPSQAGITVMAWLPEGWDDREAADRLQLFEVEANPVSTFCLEPSPPGLILGFGVATPEQLRAGLQRLQQALG